jgi:hypothetical protein
MERTTRRTKRWDAIDAAGKVGGVVPESAALSPLESRGVKLILSAAGLARS